MNRKVFAVIKREYLTRVRSKAFIIGTFVFPVFMFVIFGGVMFVGKVFESSTKEIYVIDDSDKVFAPFAALMTDTLSSGEPKYIFTRKILSELQRETEFELYRQKILDGQLYGYMVIPEDVIRSKQVTLSSKTVANIFDRLPLARALSTVITNYRLEEKGLSAEKIREEIELSKISLKKSAGD